MKIYLTYGFVIAFANLLLATLLFFLGFHSDVEKLQPGQLIAWIGSLAVSIAGIALGTKARRAEIPASEPFGYGRALGAGLLVALFAALFGAIGHIIYVTVINPDMTDVIIQAQIAQWEGMGMSSAQIENAENLSRKMMHPALQAVFAFFMSIFQGAVIALITSAFLKRSEARPLPTSA
jgi:hypothetical protein